MSKNSPIDPAALLRLERQNRVYELRVREHKTIREIAAEVGCAPSTVNKDLWVKLQENQPKELVEHYRAEQIASLNELIPSLTNTYKAMRNRQSELINQAKETKLIDLRLTLLEAAEKAGMSAEKTYASYIKTLEHLAKLSGLNAPIQVDMNITTLQDHEAELQQMIREASTQKQLEGNTE